MTAPSQQSPSMAVTPDQWEEIHLWTDAAHITPVIKMIAMITVTVRTSFKYILSQSLTGSNRNANQVVDKSKDKVDPDPLDSLFREVNAGHHIQEVILQTRQRG